jgi:hypothetical protein
VVGETWGSGVDAEATSPGDLLVGGQGELEEAEGLEVALQLRDTLAPTTTTRDATPG